MNSTRKQRSNVWKYFEKAGDGKSICKICQGSYKHSGNTTNLLKHLHSQHSEVFDESNDEIVSNKRNSKLIMNIQLTDAKIH